MKRKPKYFAVSENDACEYTSKSKMIKDIKENWGNEEIHCYSLEDIDTSDYNWRSELTSENEIMVFINRRIVK